MVRALLLRGCLFFGMESDGWDRNIPKAAAMDARHCDSVFVVSITRSLERKLTPPSPPSVCSCYRSFAYMLDNDPVLERIGQQYLDQGAALSTTET